MLRPTRVREADSASNPPQACRPVLHTPAREATAGLPEIRRPPAAAARTGQLLQTCAGAHPSSQRLPATPGAPDPKPRNPGARIDAKSRARCRPAPPEPSEPSPVQHSSRPRTCTWHPFLQALRPYGRYRFNVSTTSNAGENPFLGGLADGQMMFQCHLRRSVARGRVTREKSFDESYSYGSDFSEIEGESGELGV